MSSELEKATFGLGCRGVCDDSPDDISFPSELVSELNKRIVAKEPSVLATFCVQLRKEVL